MLLEVVIALAILSFAGLSAMRAVSDTATTVVRAEATEDDIRRASHFLEIVSLWTSADFDRHLGWREEGNWKMHIVREAPTVYVVTVADSSASRMLVETAVYRPAVHRKEQRNVAK